MHAAAKDDLTIRTALLEARYIWGEQALFGELKKPFEAEIAKGTAAEFVGAKLAERDARHRRLGDSATWSSPTSRKARAACATSTRCSGSPNTSTASTMCELVELGVLSAEEAQRFARAQDFLWTVRCHLHYLAGRAEDRLTFDLQPEIGAAWATPTTPARAASSAS